MLQWRLHTLEAFPKKRPFGCPRQPVAPGPGFLEGLGKVTNEGQGRRASSEAWADLTWAVEAELCGVTDHYGRQGPDMRWCGRALGPKYAKETVLPSRGSGKWGKLDIKTYSVLWAANRLQEMAALSAKASEGNRMGREGTGLTKGQECQWVKLVAKFASPSAPICGHIIEEEKWGMVARTVQAHAAKPAGAYDFLDSTAKWAMALLVEKVNARTAARSRGWRAWIREQCKTGGGGLHRFVKRKMEGPEVAFKIEGNLTAAPQDIADGDLATWEIIWRRHEAKAGAPWRGACVGPTTGADCTPTPKEIRKAALGFKENTGVGTDAISPRAFAWLSDELLGSIGECMTRAEEEGVWPEQVHEALMYLIPKPTGGRRPIGLLAALPRLWAKVRKTKVRGWRHELGKHYDWMRKGKGAQQAVWIQSVMEEAAQQRGLASAAVLVDLVKAFEQVMLQLVWAAGLEHGFPMKILRLSMEACAFPRRMVYRGAYSERSVSTLSAILAGHGFGTDFMLLALMGPIDQLLANHPGLSVFLVAEDATFGLHGPDEEAVAKELGIATEGCFAALEDGHGMQVSRNVGDVKGKTVAIASNARLVGLVRKRSASLGWTSGEGHVISGWNFVSVRGARSGGRAVYRDRWRAVKRLKERVKRLGHRPGAQVVNTGLIPSVKYGASVAGVMDRALAGWRSLAAAAYGNNGGRSITARLALEQADPGREVATGPIMDWITAWWDDSLDKDVMHDAWRFAIMSVGMCGRPNAAVRGGAGAFFAALRRLHWTSPSVHSSRTRDGTILFYGAERAPEGAITADPRTICRWAQDDYEIASGLNSQVARDISDIGGVRGYARANEEAPLAGDGSRRAYGTTGEEARLGMSWRRARYEMEGDILIPWFWPITRTLMIARRKGNRAAAASVRALVEGRWWVQRKLYAAGLAKSDVCRCGAASGTSWHKLGRCQLAEEERQAFNQPARFRHAGR